MEENPIQKGPGIRSIMARALLLMVRDWEPLFLIAALTTVLGAVLAWPTLDNIWYIMSHPELSEFEAQTQIQGFLDGSSFFILSLFLAQAASILWTRIWSLGRERALEGGLGALMRRALWGTFRYFGMLIWMFLGMIAMGIPLAFIAGIMTGASGAGSWSVAIVSMILYGAFAVVVGLALTAYGWSIYRESQDQHSPVLLNLKVLKDRALQLGGGFMLAVFIFVGLMLIPYSLLMGSPVENGGADGVPMSFIAWYLIGGFGGTLFSFFWITFAGLLLRSSEGSQVDLNV